MAYMISANMDSGSKEFQIEAAISKIYASVGVVSTIDKDSYKMVIVKNNTNFNTVQC